jgi:hypothetical protein
MTIKTTDNVVIGYILTNHSMTIEEAMNSLGYPWTVDDNDTGYLFDGVYYGEEHLIMDYDEQNV